MAYTPLIGSGSEVGWIPDGEVTETKLRNSKWTLTTSRALQEAPNTTDGMFRVAGRDDAEGDIEGFWNDDVPITSILASGDIGTLKLYTKAGTFFSLNAIIGDLEIETDYEDPISFTLSYSLYGGTVTPPA